MSTVNPTSDPRDSPHPPDLREDSLHLLEFHLVRERLARYTTFPPAGELALELSPSYRAAGVTQRQQETAEARRLLEGGATLELAEAHDLRQALQRAALGGVLSGEELLAVHDTLKACRVARATVLRQKGTPVLEAVARDLPVLKDLEGEIARAIGKSGEVLDAASPALRELRSESRTAYQTLMDAMERAVRRMSRRNVLQEPIITQRNGRAVLLLKTEMKHHLPGIVHDVSASGATIFVEPMATVGLGNRWRELRLSEEREEERVLRALSAGVESHSDDLLGGVDLLARLDLAMAKARYAVATRAASPTVVEGDHRFVWLTDARHPLLEGEVVPITAKVGDRYPVLVITGPNAGGKTVTLKTVGLLALMAQAGLQLPAAEATLSLFDGVYADIGDQQSIQRSLSTFSSHIENLRGIMAGATSRSLVLIDELGTSTDPEEGAALAKAVLDYFVGKGITLVATTHHRDVAGHVQEQEGMLNASVELDPRALAPTYRLTLGLPGRSYALTIASRLGLEEGVVEGARDLLSPAHQGTEDLLRELQEERRLAQDTRQEAQDALARAEAQRAALDEELAQLQDSRAEMLEEARHQLQRRVDEISQRLRAAERALERPGPVPLTPVASEAAKGTRKELTQVRRELRLPDWQPPPSRRAGWIEGIRTGDRVYLRGIPRPVEVISPPGEDGTLEVLLGTMRARLPVHQLDRAATAHTTPSGEGVYFSRATPRPETSDLDLHGVRVEEAMDRLEGFLNDAAVAGLSRVRVLHGVGSGTLRSAVREYLAHHPLVKGAGRDESIPVDSVTVVELE